MLTLAHLSDVHLVPRGAVGIGELLSKRAIGFVSWHMKRKRRHLNRVLDVLCDDIRNHAPQHIALTGDLINIASKSEFAAGKQWLEAFGSSKDVSFVPGNHDAYVHVPWPVGLGQWKAYMCGDIQHGPGLSPNCHFPFVRKRRNVAMIGISSAQPAPFHQASGEIGARQLEALAAVLHHLRRGGLYRVVLVHHPPLPGQASTRKALRDARALKAVLETEGAELVLHGHNHRFMRTEISAPSGPVHVAGAPSASAYPGGGIQAAAWYLHTIERKDGRWRNRVDVRVFDGEKNSMVSKTGFNLDSG